MFRYLCLVLCFSLGMPAVLAGNFTLTLDGKPYEIDLDQTQKLTLPDGRKLTVGLSQKAILTFQSPNFSFQHPSNMTPTRKSLGSGVWQTLLSTADGTLILVQEYDTANPDEMMVAVLDAILADETKMHYSIQRKALTKTLANGTVTKGKFITSQGGDDLYTREVITVKTGKGGVLVFTQTNQSHASSAKPMFDLLWKTLTIPNAK